jgi:hypothetical protein
MQSSLRRYTFPIQNSLKEGNAPLSLLFNSALKDTIKKVLEKQEGMKLNMTHHLQVYTDYDNLLDKKSIRRNLVLLDPSRKLTLK